MGTHRINYSEFLAATISVKSILTHEKLEALFNQFDTDKTKEITADNIVQAMNKLGKNITKAEIEEVMKKHDASSDGKI